MTNHEKLYLESAEYREIYDALSPGPDYEEYRRTGVMPSNPRRSPLLASVGRTRLCQVVVRNFAAWVNALRSL